MQPSTPSEFHREDQAFLQALLEAAERGVCARPLVHEVNNFLNVVSLQTEFIARQAPEGIGEELRSIRRQVAALAALMQQWVDAAPRAGPQRARSELNEVVRRALDGLVHEVRAPGLPALRLDAGAGESLQPEPGQVVVLLGLTKGTLPVEGAFLDVYLLVRFLVRDAAASAPSSGGVITIRTAHEGKHVVVRVEDEGPTLEPDVLAHLFDASMPAREGSSRLILAACESLARGRLGGSIFAENREEGGLAVVVHLKPLP